MTKTQLIDTEQRCWMYQLFAQSGRTLDSTVRRVDHIVISLQQVDCQKRFEGAKERSGPHSNVVSHNVDFWRRATLESRTKLIHIFPRLNQSLTVLSGLNLRIPNLYGSLSPWSAMLAISLKAAACPVNQRRRITTCRLIHEPLISETRSIIECLDSKSS